MTRDEFLTVLGLTESDGDPRAWGDELGDPPLPEAMGRWQVHPAWFIQYVHDLLTDEPGGEGQPTIHETWDSYVGRIVGDFFDVRAALYLPVEIAMWFHVGHETRSGSPDWDPNYAARFEKFAAQQSGGGAGQ